MEIRKDDQYMRENVCLDLFHCNRSTKELLWVFHLDVQIIGWSFCLIFVEILNLADSLRISLCMYGQKAYWPRLIIPRLPGCVRLCDSSTASSIVLGIATLVYASWSVPKLTPVGVNIRDHIFASLLIILQNAIYDFFQCWIFASQGGQNYFVNIWNSNIWNFLYSKFQVGSFGLSFEDLKGHSPGVSRWGLWWSIGAIHVVRFERLEQCCVCRV